MLAHSLAERMFVAAVRNARCNRLLPQRIARRLARFLPARRVEPLRCRFEALLGEPTATAHALALDWFFYKQLEASSWLDGGCNTGVLHDAGRIRAYLHDAPRGVVIATIHMGNYLEGLRQLRFVTPPGRPIYVLRRRDADQREQGAFARVGGSSALTVVRNGHASLTTLVRALRRGAMLVALYDLPARYARTVPVVFFGRPAAFVRGPAELAVLGNADVLPLLCHYDASLTPIASAAPILAAPSEPGVRAARTAALTQQLCDLAEAHIRAYPSQWGHWSLVDELLAAPP